MKSLAEGGAFCRAILAVYAVFESETAFRRALLETTGFSPAQYKVQLRIKKAKELIRYSPDISTDMLVEELGFTDSSYFYKVFEKVSGETLKQYRKKYK